MRLSAVVLPAPLGPMTPSASPSSTARLRPSMTTSEPNDFATPSSESSTWGAPGGPPKPSALRAPAEPWRSADVNADLPEGLERPCRRDVGRRLVADDHHVEGKLLALHPLAADERGLGDVGHRPLGPADWAHDRRSEEHTSELQSLRH